MIIKERKMTLINFKGLFWALSQKAVILDKKNEYYSKVLEILKQLLNLSQLLFMCAI